MRYYLTATIVAVLAGFFASQKWMGINFIGFNVETGIIGFCLALMAAIIIGPERESC